MSTEKNKIREKLKLIIASQPQGDFTVEDKKISWVISTLLETVNPELIIGFVPGAWEPKILDIFAQFKYTALVKTAVHSTLELKVWDGSPQSLVQHPKLPLWEPHESLPTIPWDNLGKPGLIILFVPGLGFDQSNMRIGHGKGYYDRLIGDLRSTRGPGELLVVGVCYSCQVLDKLPSEPHDMGVDVIISGGPSWDR